MHPKWIRDATALALLDHSGEPFNLGGYRRAWTGVTSWRDVSFGARAEDGTLAAVALLRRRGSAQSLPLGYGGIAATRALHDTEASALLSAARHAARAYELRAFSVPVDPAAPQHGGGRVYGSTSVVYLDPETPIQAGFTKKGRSTIKRALRAGGVARSGGENPEPFLRLYRRASQAWGTAYPFAVLRRLAAAGLLRLYDVELNGAIESSVAALPADRHWMYWLAAQSDRGRKAELGYLAVEALISDAHSEGAVAVNLGASAGLPGVAHFKRQFGSVDVPVIEHRSALTVAVNARSLTSAVQRRIHGLGRRGPAS
jgi:hypothetical protein